MLPIVRPGRPALHGEDGLVRSLEAAAKANRLGKSRADIRAAVDAGASAVAALLGELAARAAVPDLDDGTAARPPRIVLAVDQGEELFLSDGSEEAAAFLALIRDLVAGGALQPDRAVHHPLGFLRAVADGAGARRPQPADLQPAADAARRLPDGDRGSGEAPGRHRARADRRAGADRGAARRHRGGRRQGRAAAARLHAAAPLRGIRHRRQGDADACPVSRAGRHPAARSRRRSRMR